MKDAIERPYSLLASASPLNYILSMNDSILPEEDPIVALDVFEGPLDLLLHLVKLNEINILELPMELITHQYLSTLKAFGKMELPVAGEYFVMAAELLKIKSQMLLPRAGCVAGASNADLKALEHSTGPDPRGELIKQLLDYQKLKANAALLEVKIEAQALSYACLKASPPIERPLKPFDRFDLMGSYSILMRRLLERVAIGEIALDPFTVSQAIEHILSSLNENSSVAFSTLIAQGEKSLYWIAAMFVAVLELTRLGEINLIQDGSFGEISLMRKVAAA